MVTVEDLRRRERGTRRKRGREREREREERGMRVSLALFFARGWLRNLMIVERCIEGELFEGQIEVRGQEGKRRKEVEPR